MSKDNTALHIIGLVSVFVGLLLLVLSSPNEVLASSTTLYFPHTDHQGSVIAVTDESGAVVSENRYFPYGSTRQEVGSKDISERKYTSQIKDTEADLYYYNARYYDPILTTFVSADNVSSNLNRYAYVSGNPVNFIDPTGRFCENSSAAPLSSAQAPFIDICAILGALGVIDEPAPPPPGEVAAMETANELRILGEKAFIVGATVQLGAGFAYSTFCSINPEACGSLAKRGISTALNDVDYDIYGEKLIGGNTVKTYVDQAEGVVTQLQKYEGQGLSRSIDFYNKYGGQLGIPKFVGEVPGGYQIEYIRNAENFHSYLLRGGKLTSGEISQAISDLGLIQQLTGQAHGDIYLTNAFVNGGNVLIQNLAGGEKLVRFVDFELKSGYFTNIATMKQELYYLGQALLNTIAIQ